MKPLLEEISLGIYLLTLLGSPKALSSRDKAWIYLCFLNSGGLPLAQGVIAGIWVWGLVYCLFHVRNVDPFWLMRCNDCRSPCSAWGYVDDVNALNYVVNTFKQKLLMTTLAAGLFLQGSYLCLSGLKCGAIFQRDPQKVAQQTSEVCK